MKTLKLSVFILSVFMLSIISCQMATPVVNKSDYHAGIKAGDDCAKRDAMNFNCFNSSLFNSSFWIRTNLTGKLDERIAAMKNKKSESFIRGFYWSYKRSYFEYLDTYCGD